MAFFSDRTLKKSYLYSATPDFFGVIYAHKLRVSVGDCIRDLEIIAKAATPEELANRVQYLPL
ncbi:MAG: hypothetical protein ACRC11_05820 [Xenococcaceae cyanobacterium]